VAFSMPPNPYEIAMQKVKAGFNNNLDGIFYNVGNLAYFCGAVRTT
jgi:hypothetical protein